MCWQRLFKCHSLTSKPFPSRHQPAWGNQDTVVGSHDNLILPLHKSFQRVHLLRSRYFTVHKTLKLQELPTLGPWAQFLYKVYIIYVFEAFLHEALPQNDSQHLPTTNVHPASSMPSAAWLRSTPASLKPSSFLNISCTIRVNWALKDKPESDSSLNQTGNFSKNCLRWGMMVMFD